MANDPVCGNNIQPKCSEWLVEYQGNVFHFCTSTCRDKFVENPQEFIVNGSTFESEDLMHSKEKTHANEIVLA
jgi:YHS domain-containing protein